jgi:hypothetical protein
MRSNDCHTLWKWACMSSNGRHNLGKLIEAFHILRPFYIKFMWGLFICWGLFPRNFFLRGLFLRSLFTPTPTLGPDKIVQLHSFYAWAAQFNWYLLAMEEYTVVGVSTRPAPLIISKSLQYRIFWSQSKALFMIRCMLSVGSGSKMFGAQKVTILCQIFW